MSRRICPITSWDGNVSVILAFCEGNRQWITPQRASNAEHWYFFCCVSMIKLLNKRSSCRWFEAHNRLHDVAVMAHGFTRFSFVWVKVFVLVYLLWTDDLILFSDTPNGLQKQLNGLYTFCANNHMIVNEAKSKVVCFVKQAQFCVSFNHKEIEQVDRYKYLGNIIRRVDRHQQDIFADNYKYLCEQASKAENTEYWCTTTACYVLHFWYHDKAYNYIR